MEFDIERIVLTFGEISADQYLGKSIEKHRTVILSNIQELNEAIAQLEKNEAPDKLREYIIEVAYRYYLLKDGLLSQS